MISGPRQGKSKINLENPVCQRFRKCSKKMDIYQKDMRANVKELPLTNLGYMSAKILNL